MVLSIMQGRSSIKTVEGQNLKEFRPPSLADEKNFSFFFSGIFLKIFKVFLVPQNNLCETSSFYKVFFHKSPENYERFSSNETM